MEAPRSVISALFGHTQPTAYRAPGVSALSLDDLLVRNAAATFFLRMNGEHLRGLGIENGDILIADASATCRPGGFVLASDRGRLLVRHYVWESGQGYVTTDAGEREPVGGALEIVAVITTVARALV